MSAELIRHGRRSGQSRRDSGSKSAELPRQQLSPPQQGPRGMMLPDGTDLRQVTVLSKTDWQRIQDQLSKSSREEQRMRAQREQELALHERSKEVVKNWSNTIAGQRLKKLEARKIREEKEEEEKVQLDIEEAKFQSEKRKIAIDKAKTQQYYQTDRVKGFHGALLLTEVLKEREAQIEFRKARERASAGKDRDIYMRYQREVEMGILEDQAKARTAMEERRKCKEFQLHQINDHLKKEDLAKLTDVREGEEIKRNTERYEAEKRRIEEIKRKEREDIMKAHLQTVKDRDLIRAAERQKEEEEEEEIRIFAAAKRKMGKLRKTKEKELWLKKQDHTNKMVELLHGQLKQKVDNEDERIIKAVGERERIEEMEDKAKEEKLHKTLQSIAEHRTTQMKLAEKQERENKRKETENLLLRVEADRIFQSQQEEKMRAAKAEAQALQGFHNKQIDENIGGIRKEQQDQLEHDQRNLELLKLEEDQFQEYAAKVITHCHKNGRNVYPLVKAAREGHGGGMGPVFEGKGGIRPSYLVQDATGVELPTYQKDSTTDVKSGQNSGDSRKRLGFVW
ncbi:cilia- and flagella- associated protein 210-like [Saccoglossus kowalevskii]|uniref:Coiled-coil domain-containing protein 173-like n=1 Tax=Saccoglossus kowalevskii TaxID=10224 RepID=A0ABM0GX03_SACKO|nr:PREDICTED: coiled-coil domain-containing protein 173-like [Saccoglossus kowalevskii]